MEAIKARAKAATKGPWIEGQPGNFRVYGPANMGRQSGPLLEIQILGVSDPEIEGANRAFIAHARQDIPALIARIEALEAQKWDVQHTDAMNDMVALGIDRDSWKARAEALEEENKKLHLLADNLATLANVKPDLDGEGGGGGENFYPDD